MKKILKEISSYVVIIIIVVLIRTFIITPVIVDGPSMENTLYDGEILILNKLSKTLDKIKRFDIVVVDIKEEKELIIKRVIGMPGDAVSYKDDKLYINEKEVKDYGIGHTEDFTLGDICKQGNNLDCNNDIIPENYYLVLGDNREVSYDSRQLGLINYKYITGKVVFKIFPLTKIGTIK